MKENKIEEGLDGLFALLDFLQIGSDDEQEIISEGVNLFANVWNFFCTIILEEVKKSQDAKLLGLISKMQSVNDAADAALASFDPENLESYEKLVEIRNELAASKLAMMEGK